MPVHFIGAIGGGGLQGRIPAADEAHLLDAAQAHENADFDRVLVGDFGGTPESIQILAYAAEHTDRLGFLLAHRPGFAEPALAARQLAALDHFSSGRLAIQFVSGGANADQERPNGDLLSAIERDARFEAYLDEIRSNWAEARPFGRCPGRAGKPHPPIFLGGSSEGAVAVAARHADVFVLRGVGLPDTADAIDAVRMAAARHRRDAHIQFAISLRPVIADTEEAAWERAGHILRVVRTPFHPGWRRSNDASVGDEKPLEAIAALTGVSGGAEALVGTAEQVAERLLAYHDLGIAHFLIRGFDPIEDAAEYGRRLIPLVRAAVAERDAAPLAAE